MFLERDGRNLYERSRAFVQIFIEKHEKDEMAGDWNQRISNTSGYSSVNSL